MVAEVTSDLAGGDRGESRGGTEKGTTEQKKGQFTFPGPAGVLGCHSGGGTPPNLALQRTLPSIARNQRLVLWGGRWWVRQRRCAARRAQERWLAILAARLRLGPQTSCDLCRSPAIAPADPADRYWWAPPLQTSPRTSRQEGDKRAGSVFKSLYDDREMHISRP
jgi:hypothetical protein